MKKAEMPDWALKYQTEGTQIVKIGKGYYLYKVTSRWCHKKGRSQKITEKYLGKITPEGVIKPLKERINESIKNIAVKEYGATQFIIENNKDIIEILKSIYPYTWKEIFVFSVFRLLYSSPIKLLQDYYTTSFISETIKDAFLSQRNIGNLLREIGKEREKEKIFLKHFIAGTKFALIDLTHVFSFSENVISATTGYNSKMEFLPQINFSLLFSLDKHLPVYFRIIPGNIRDVSSLILTVEESDAKEVVIIGDKGFYSEENIRTINEDLNILQKKNINYIFPLRRNLSIIDYKIIEKGDKRAFERYFLFEGRPIWHYKYPFGEGKKIIVFLDPKLKAEEEKDFLFRAENDKEKLEKFFTKQHRLGTIAVITSMDESNEKIYELLTGCKGITKNEPLLL
ncbi:conserved hypothetical protein [groundwater metagenome]|uniref:Transposase IS4-like domain-containing protein n=1 Tax=groundwater metagenome TaxID=717931 RepID=A0A098ECX5_9ZZZZ